MTERQSDAYKFRSQVDRVHDIVGGEISRDAIKTIVAEQDQVIDVMLHGRNSVVAEIDEPLDVSDSSIVVSESAVVDEQPLDVSASTLPVQEDEPLDVSASPVRTVTAGSEYRVHDHHVGHDELYRIGPDEAWTVRNLTVDGRLDVEGTLRHYGSIDGDGTVSGDGTIISIE